MDKVEVARLSLPYLQLFQRSTYGTARWANARLLEDLNLARRKSEPIKAVELSLGAGQGLQRRVERGAGDMPPGPVRLAGFGQVGDLLYDLAARVVGDRFRHRPRPENS
ncbi:MAG: hypothetical protein MOB07_28105 [Acidobacteria bacterium]|nr:hypothetical protein [Acidobacteriota bacterium]